MNNLEDSELPKVKPVEVQTPAPPNKAPETVVEGEVALLKTKLNDARKKAGEHREAVLNLESIFTEDITLSDKIKDLSKAEVLDEANRLSEPGALKNIQELKYSSQVAIRVSDLYQGAKQREKKASSERDKLISKRKRLQSDLEAREKQTGLRRIVNGPTRASISRNIQELDVSIARLKEQEYEASNQASECEKNHSRLREAQEKTFLEAEKLGLEKIKESYGEFLDSIFEDGKMLREIRELYIERNIVPKLENLEQEGRIKTEDSERFLSQLRASLKERDKSKEREDNSIPQELKEVSNDFYSEVEPDTDNLLEGRDRFIIERFVSQLAYDELSQLREGVVDLRNSYNWKRSVDSAFESIFQKPQYGHDEEKSPFRGQIQPITAETVFYRTMDLFDVARESKIARAVFGEDYIDRIDNEIYKTVMDKALSDREGNYIDMLAYYPTPEGIRNLVVIAAADYKINKSGRTRQANWALYNLARRKTWGALLDHTEIDFPTLVKARKVLEAWTYRGDQNNPKIKQACVDLALSIISTGGNTDQRLIDLAVESLPNDDLLSLLVKENALAIDDVLAVRKGMEFLQGYDETLEQKEARLPKEKKYGVLTEEELQRSNVKEHLRRFEDIVRETALRIKHVASDESKKEQLPELLERFNRLGRIANEWQKHTENLEMLDYLTSYYFLDLAKDVNEERVALLFRATDYCPVLASEKGSIFFKTLEERPEVFLTENGLKFLQRFSDAYSDYPEWKAREIVNLVTSKQLSWKRAEILPFQASDLLELDSKHFYLVTEFPELFLASNKGIVFYRKLAKVYQEQQQLREFSSAVANHNLPKELALTFSKVAPLLMDPDRQATHSFILQNAQSVARNEKDLKFLNSFVGIHGKAADQLVRDYTLCVKAGSVDSENRPLVLEFTKQFRVLSPCLFDRYKDAFKSGTTEIYLSRLKSIAERMTSSSSLTEQDRKLPYYKDLVKAVYPNNSGRWTSYKNNETCADRSEDLADFKVRSRYDIDLMSSAEIRLKDGEVLAQDSINKIKDKILALYKKTFEHGYNLEHVREDLKGEVDEALVKIREAGGLSNIDFDKIQTAKEKMFLLLTDNVYGLRITDADTLKQLLVKYEFAYFDDIRQYIQGTSDRVSRANNQDYALLCELHSFFSDRIKEVNRSLVKTGWDNPTVAKAMPHYFTQLSEELYLAKQQDQINRIRIDRLGLNDSFVQQLDRTLSGKTGRKYTPKQVRRLISLYESVAGGLQEKTTTSPKKRTKALYGQLKAQRDKTFQAMKAITGEVVDPVDVHLGNIDLQELLSQQRDLATAQYDSKMFANYTAQRFLELFSEERNVLGTELDKFESSTGKNREVVHGYITKTKESANARMVGGVCVCGDNPGKSGEKCQWNMPNYFQLVLQDPETLRCQGLALLHHFTDKGGKKILTASLNPSSTYLYSVDEAGLFEGMMGTLEQFAQDNEFDLILVSKNKTIRTNRTGGEFDRAIDRRVGQLDESYVFDKPKQFSYSPPYSMDAMDVVWKKAE